MRVSKLITLSTVAVLMGGASFAIGASQQSAAQEISDPGPMRHYAPKKALHPRVGAARARAERELRRIPPHKRHSLAPAETTGPAFGRATLRELEAGLSPQERARLTEEIPRLSSIGTEPRIHAIVPRSVRRAAAPLPPSVQRKYPRFAQDRAIIYRDQVVIVDPTTSRIVALVATGS